MIMMKKFCSDETFYFVILGKIPQKSPQKKKCTKCTKYINKIKCRENIFAEFCEIQAETSNKSEKSLVKFMLQQN